MSIIGNNVRTGLGVCCENRQQAKIKNAYVQKWDPVLFLIKKSLLKRWKAPNKGDEGGNKNDRCLMNRA
jgi:hypothetical protein